jgi:scyllo-inositol 2-dehydrogenase (NADP+)
MTRPEKINVAVIGLGWVATNRHIPIILRHPRLQLYGVVDKHQERIQNLTNKYTWLRASVSREGEMPWGNEVQAVVIATDPMNHYPLAKKMLIAGKHVLMEKPLTMSPVESHELQEISASKVVTCCVVHNFQFARSTLQLKELIDSGVLGEIQNIEAVQLSNPRRRLPAWYEQLPYGLFYDESPHMFYMLEALAEQEIRHVSSTILRKTGQNTPIIVTGHYTSGLIPIRLSMNFNAALSEWHIAVIGSKGIGIVDIFRDILVTVPNDGLHRAREILATSGSFITTHLWGFFKSGVRLLGSNLFYGSDIVWDRFVNELDGKQIASEISVARGDRIVNLQHEIMEKSTTFDLPEHEDPDIQ